MDLTIPMESLRDVLRSMVQADGPGILRGARLHTCGVPVTITDGTTIADMRAGESDYPGYAPVDVGSWSAVMSDGLRAYVETGIVSMPPASAGQNDVYAVWLSSSDGMRLLACGLVDPAITIEGESYLQAIVRLGFLAHP